MEESITNLQAYDAFADTGTANELSIEGYIHIRIQQRNGRKSLTTVQGMPVELDQKRILKAFKKDFACNGNIIEDSESGQVIQLSGDQRLKVKEFLITEEICSKEKIKVHGF